MKNSIKFMENAGGCIVSKNIIEEKGKLKWLLRDKSVSNEDNGWRFFSDIDDSDFISNSSNLIVCDFNSVANIEPAILAIYNFPIGSDFQLVKEDGKIKFFDNNTGKEIDF